MKARQFKIHLDKLSADLPDISDEPTRCIRLNEEWCQLFIGVLSALRYKRAVWAGTAEEASIASDNVCRALEIFAAGVCDVIEDIRIEGCMLQKKVDGDWVDIGNILEGFNLSATTLPPGEDATVVLDDCDLTFGIPAGEQGEQGEPGEAGAEGETGATGPAGAPGQDGEDGEDGQDGEDGVSGLPGEDGMSGLLPPAAETEYESVDNICAACTDMVLWMVDNYSQTLDEWLLRLQEIKAVTDTIVAIVEFITAGVGELVPIDETANFFYEINVLDLSIIKTTINNPAFQEEITGELFCRIMESGTLTFTQEIYEEWRDNDIGNGGVFGHGMGDWLKDFATWGKVSGRFALYALNENDQCATLFGCQPVWEHVFEFDNDLEGWESIDTTDAGTRYTLQSDGIASGDATIFANATWYRVLGTMRYTFDETVNLVSISLHFDFDGGSDHLLRIQTNSTNHDYSPEDAPDQTQALTGSFDVNTIGFVLYGDGKPNAVDLVGGFKVYSVTIRGTGTNPFE